MVFQNGYENFLHVKMGREIKINCIFCHVSAKFMQIIINL